MSEVNDSGYRKYLEANSDDPYSKLRLRLLDKGLPLIPPKPMTPEILEEYYASGIIRKEELKDNSFYLGICRNATVAVWNASKGEFYYLRRKFNDTFSEPINHLADDNGYDLFVPIKELELK